MLIGICIGLGLSLVLFLCGYIGYKLANRRVDKLKVQSQTEQELDALKKREEGFKNIFDYDVNVALGKRVAK